MFFITFFQLIYSDDNKLAADLCKKNKQAISEFLEIYSDELYYIATKFNNRGIFLIEKQNYMIKKILAYLKIKKVLSLI